MPPVGCLTCGSGRKPIGNRFCRLISAGDMLERVSQVSPPLQLDADALLHGLPPARHLFARGVVAHVVALVEELLLVLLDGVFCGRVFGEDLLKRFVDNDRRVGMVLRRRLLGGRPGGGRGGATWLARARRVLSCGQLPGTAENQKRDDANWNIDDWCETMGVHRKTPWRLVRGEISWCGQHMCQKIGVRRCWLRRFGRDCQLPAAAIRIPSRGENAIGDGEQSWAKGPVDCV